MEYIYNKEQEKVISYPLNPLLVLAGAGSGKTSTIIGRIINLVNDRFIIKKDDFLLKKIKNFEQLNNKYKYENIL